MKNFLNSILIFFGLNKAEEATTTMQNPLLQTSFVFNPMRFSYIVGKGAFFKYNAPSGGIVVDYSRTRNSNHSYKTIIPPGSPESRDGAVKAELLGMQDDNGKPIVETGGYAVYTFSIWIDPAYVPPVNKKGNPSHGTLFQIHKADADGEGGTGPAIAITAEPNLVLKVRGGNISYAPKEVVVNFSRNSLNKGKWIDIILEIKFDKTSGYAIVYRRDEDEREFQIVAEVHNFPTQFYDTSGTYILVPHWGQYMATQYDNITRVVYYSEITKVKTLADAKSYYNF